MAPLDVLIVILYVTFAIYVMYQARRSYLLKKAASRAKAKQGLILLEPDQAALDRGLEDQLAPLALKGFLDLKLSDGIYLDNMLNILSITIENRSTTYAVYMNWKESWLTNSSKQSRSIARLTPNEGISQNASMVPPEQVIKEAFTIMTPDGIPQPIPEAVKLHLLRQANQSKNPSAQVLLSLSIQLRSVSQYSKNHLIAVSCPITFKIPTDDQVQEWVKRKEKKVTLPRR